MKLSPTRGAARPGRYAPRHDAPEPAARAKRAIALCIRWWRTAVHLAVTGIVIAVVSHNATSPYPAVPADGSPSVPHVHSLP